MLDEKLLKKIKEYIINDELTIIHTPKFINKDFKCELVEDIKECHLGSRFENNNYLVYDDNKKIQLFYRYSEEEDAYMIINGSPEDFLSKIPSEYKGATFNCNIFIVENFEFAWLDNFIPRNEIFEVPDEINGIPVLAVSLDSSIKLDFIKKIIIGNNLICVTNFSKFNRKKYVNYLKQLNKVVINKEYNGSINFLTEFIISFLYSSDHKVNINIEEGALYKIIDNYLVSSDEKNLYLITKELNDIIIPEKVEHIHSEAFYFCSSSINISWSKNLKKIDALPYFYDQYNKLPDTIEIINSSTLYKFIDKKGNLTIPNNIKEVSIFFEDSYYNNLPKITNICINNNDNFIFEDGLLLTKDKKTLILCLLNIKNVLLPEYIEKIQDNSFVFSPKTQIISLKTNNNLIIKQLENYGFKIEIKKNKTIREHTIELDGAVYNYSIKNKKEVKLLSCVLNKDFDTLVLPSFIESLPVTIICKNFLTSNDKIVNKLILPSEVRELKEKCFYSNKKLKSVIISNSIEILGESCFDGCENLKKVEIDYTKSRLKIIKRLSFFRCINLCEFRCPQNLEIIEEQAFMWCANKNNVFSLYLNDKLLEFRDYALELNLRVYAPVISNEENDSKMKLYVPLNLLINKIVKIHYYYCDIFVSNLIAEIEINKVTYGITSNGAVAISTYENVDELIILDKVKFHNKEYDVVGIMSYFSKYKRMTKINKINIPNKLIFIGNQIFKNMKIMCPIIFPSTLSMIYNSFDNTHFCGETEIYSYVYFKKNQKELYWTGDVPSAPLFFEDISNVYFDIHIERSYKKYIDHPIRCTEFYDKFPKEQIIFENNMYYLITKDGIKCLRYIDDSIVETPDFSIPLSNGGIINGILPFCFSNCGHLEKVYINKNIETIGEYAFGHHTKCIIEKGSLLKAIGKESIYVKDKNINGLPECLEYIDYDSFFEDEEDEVYDEVIKMFFKKNIFTIPKQLKVFNPYFPEEIKEIIFEDGAEPDYVEVPYYGDANYRKLKYNKVNNGFYLGSKENKNLIFCGTENDCEYIAIAEGTRIIAYHTLDKNENLREISLPDSLVAIHAAPNSKSNVIVKKWPKSLRYISEQFYNSIDIKKSPKLPEGVVLYSCGNFELHRIYNNAKWVGHTNLIIND